MKKNLGLNLSDLSKCIEQFELTVLYQGPKTDI